MSRILYQHFKDRMSRIQSENFSFDIAKVGVIWVGCFDFFSTFRKTFRIIITFPKNLPKAFFWPY